MFDCPRCGAKDIATPYYGPCPTCRDQLNATMFKEPTERGEAASYVPNLHVTPHAVARQACD